MYLLGFGVLLSLYYYLFYHIPSVYLDQFQKPNIIVIIADDCGWNDFGIHGSNQIPTPNIDALAYNGITFTKFYTQAICTPSRSSFLTGQYPIRLGMQGSPIIAGENRSLPLGTPTMAELLKELGYKTHLVGKWHLGAAYRRDTPLRRGFDSHFGYWNGFVGYFNFRSQAHHPNLTTMDGFDLHDGFTPVYSSSGRYATKLFTEKTVEMIQNHDSKDPLFLMLSHLAGHTGYNGDELGVPDLQSTNEKYSYISDERRRLYADIVNIMDDSVGKVVEALAQKQMLENSIILFFSDNGGQTVGTYANSASNWPLRGLKFTLLDGGVRGTAAVYSPLFRKKGYINNQLFHLSDWLPTFYAAAGGKPGRLGKIDGVNQWNVLSRNYSTSRKEILVNIDEVLNYSALIKGKYKLVNGTFNDGVYDGYHGEDGRGPENPPYNISAILESPTNLAIQQLDNSNKLTEQNILNLRQQLELSSWCRSDTSNVEVCDSFCLFNLEEDPCERNNILEREREVTQQMKERLSIFYRELVPQTNKFPDLNSNPIYYNDTWCTWLDVEFCQKTSKAS